jgi:hypothetical protein
MRQKKQGVAGQASAEFPVLDTLVQSPVYAARAGIAFTAADNAECE